MATETRPTFGPKPKISQRRPMFGPRQGSKVWKEVVARDVRKKNLEKARAVRAENLKAKKLAKEKNVTNSKTGR